MTTTFRRLCLTLFCAAALMGLGPSPAGATPAALLWTSGPLINPPVVTLAPAVPTAMQQTLAALAAPAEALAGKGLPSFGPGDAQVFLAALRAPQAATAAASAEPLFAAGPLASPLALSSASGRGPEPLVPVIAIVALDAVRPEFGPALFQGKEEPAPLLAQAPLEAVRPEETPAAEPGVLTLAELESHAGGTGVSLGVLTNQILTGVSSGNSINAGQVSSGGVTIETDAFSGYDGIGNFMINSGHNNVLQSTVNVTIVMTPP